MYVPTFRMLSNRDSKSTQTVLLLALYNRFYSSLKLAKFFFTVEALSGERQITGA